MNLPSSHYSVRKNRHKAERSAAAFRHSRTKYPGLQGVVDHIKALALQSRGDIEVRRKAMELTEHIPVDPRTGHPDRRNFGNIATALYEWMKANIAYVRDPHFVEWLQDAKVTMRERSGDCDDMVILSAAMLMSLGVPVRIVVVAQKNTANPDEYSHIYLEFQHNGKWHPFDVTLASRAGSGIPEHLISKKWIIPMEGEGTQINDAAILSGISGRSGYLNDRSSGAAAGVAAGAAAGSVVPGVGTAIGAGVGALVGGITGLITGAAASKAQKRAKRDSAVGALISAGANQQLYIHYNNHEAATRLALSANANPYLIHAINEIMPINGDWEIHVKSKPEILQRIYARGAELLQLAQRGQSAPTPGTGSIAAAIQNFDQPIQNNNLLVWGGILAVVAGGSYLILK
jgi:hypothetical protein